ncbi:MAG TPA: glycosyltransferase [Polyangiaceae bacterium]|nr:glycosyltransferase [Polyangiaceae bacterium]
MTVDLLAVYTPVGGGHKAAALATCEAARARGLGAEGRDLFQLAPRIFGDTYVAAHLNGQARAPNLYGKGYFSSNRRGGALEPMRLGFDRVVFGRLLREVRALRPRVIVATHHLPLVVLGRARRKGLLDVPVVGVVTDYTAHAVWAERGIDAFCAAAPLAAQELAAHGVDPSRVILTGIPVREAFEAAAPVRNPSADEPLRVLVTSGGFGVGPMRGIVESFAGSRGVELTVVCGASEELRARVAGDVERLAIPARVLGFERDMPSRVAEAHIVVGKAGGLTVSETMTAGRPMVIVGTIPGNELLNERYVVSAGAGYAAKPSDVGPLALAMRGRGEIATMGGRARRHVIHRSSERVLSVCGQVLDTRARAA